MTAHRHPRLLSAVLAASVLLAACGSDSEPAETATDTGEGTVVAFDHSQGTTDVPADPQRIVTTTDQNALLPLLELGIVPSGQRRPHR